MSFDDYMKALKMGKKEYQKHLSEGTYPYLQALEESISHVDIVSEVKLGLQQIPAELVAGTKSAGRRTAFAPNFMPLLEPRTEFSNKWIALCDSHLEEGIHDPVTACEFMGRYYIVEGNKRTSVLKYFGAPFIPAVVTRMVPRRTDEADNRIYYEYMEFYEVSGVNYCRCGREGGYAALAKAVAGDSRLPWDEETRMDFSAAFAKFHAAYLAKGGNRLPICPGDALLAYVNVYGYDALKEAPSSEVRENVSRIWDEFRLLTEDETVELVMDPNRTAPKKKFFELLLPQSTKPVKIAFLHSKDAGTSSWTYAHELGRRHVEEVFGGQAETFCYDNVAPGEMAYETLVRAIGDGCRILFTTTPEFISSSLKAAVEFPDVKILNCSLNTSHRYIRTYYGRMYEAKFLSGMIAGSLAENGRIGYIADYPIYGMTASINAFALGARMVNPRARIYLKWSTVKDDDIMNYFREKKVSYVSSQDMIVPRYASRQFGLYRFESGPEDWNDVKLLFNAATPLWNWGKFYEKIIRSILSSSWHEEEPADGTKALNYWWGLSAGVVDLIYSQNLPIGTRRLVEFLRRGIETGAFHPFAGRLYSQTGAVQEDENRTLAPEEIITMDWLAENVVGIIPDYDSLTDDAKGVVLLQGIKRSLP